MNETNGKCLFPGCAGEAYARGLCTRHYIRALRYVRTGRVTWDQLEANGKCAPRKKIYSLEPNWFLDGVK